ncbi:MAG: LysE family translocator [Burkholderiales bacterium]|nr:LysE family translocator [Burkholderiales bacterium]
MTNSVARGTAAGIKVCGGIASAALVHVTAATLGLTAFLSAVPTAFFAVKAAGAVYLMWLGWQMLRRPASLDTEIPATYWSSPFAQGEISNLLNPKMAIFFLAILPQFIDPSRGNAMMQAAFFGIFSVTSAAAINLCTATLGGKARQLVLNRPNIFCRFQQIAGIALIGLGLKVAVERAR